VSDENKYFECEKNYKGEMSECSDQNLTNGCMKVVLCICRATITVDGKCRSLKEKAKNVSNTRGICHVGVEGDGQVVWGSVTFAWARCLSSSVMASSQRIPRVVATESCKNITISFTISLSTFHDSKNGKWMFIKPDAGDFY
jgi:hypothetical protein